MELAAEIAAERQHAQVESDDILFGLIREGDGVAANILKHFKVEHSCFETDIAPRQSDRNRERPVEFRHNIGPKGSEIIETALKEAKLLNHNYVGTEHLLLGICGVPNCAAYETVARFGIQPGEICKEIVNLLGAGSEEWKRQHPNIDFTTGTKLYILLDQ